MLEPLLTHNQSHGRTIKLSIAVDAARQEKISPTHAINMARPQSTGKSTRTLTILLVSAILTIFLWYRPLNKSSEELIVKESKFESWIETQADLSWRALLRNIGANGTLPGVVLASPSTYKPDYYYCWTRDAAIVFKEIIYRYEDGDDSLLGLIKEYVSASKVIQEQSWLYSKVGLGEPKYHVDGRVFTGPWGRPQRDGPALRATSLMKFARIYLLRGGTVAAEYVREVLYDGQWASRSVIKADLEYIAATWREKSFDLWEEVDGHHFFTFSVIQRALADGASFSRQMGDPGAADWYQSQLLEIRPRLKLFWDEKKLMIVATRNWTSSHGKTSWVDVGTILAGLYAGPDAHPNSRLSSAEMLATYRALVDSMVDLYPLNQLYATKSAKAIGRYPEDIYDGVETSQGNPWFIATLSLAEMLFRIANSFHHHQRFLTSSQILHIDHMTLGFWKDFDDENVIEIGTKISFDSLEMTNLISRVRSVADEYVKIASDWVGINGSMHEQFDRHNGSPIGARDLTWSYATFLSMQRARKMIS
ncbi:hypothetical protein CROQUDRAFT_664660 [Cronartium quercuum f. sp. fusiforme G11]|uniref:glucan 1,4-alpha-glucosidase n=1 Tax=Cronartium quercuum f. sp. fusiforme G11 TaxID=708437 RepID=A0A9P6N891_9BASI|nr:hypothetical protein CROQUDRAFT_664660 [Cronartium quercuum f. sp. fusiforme G11]